MLWFYLTALLPVGLLVLVFLHDWILSSVPRRMFTPVGRAVLLVDDDPKVCQITGHNLQHHGFAVLAASDGETALKLAKTYPGQIDLLISDVIMPGMSGLLLAEQVQAIRPLTPVLFISGVAEPDTLPQSSEARVDFLGKPFTTERLTRKIRHVLGTAA